MAGFFSKIDPILGDIVLKSKPSDATSTSNDATSNQSSKRKLSELDETQGNSSKKKANVGSNNGHLTLSQREQKGIDSLASYLEERGGKSTLLVVTSLLSLLFFIRKLISVIYIHR